MATFNESDDLRDFTLSDTLVLDDGTKHRTIVDRYSKRSVCENCSLKDWTKCYKIPCIRGFHFKLNKDKP